MATDAIQERYSKASDADLIIDPAEKAKREAENGRNIPKSVAGGVMAAGVRQCDSWAAWADRVDRCMVVGFYIRHVEVAAPPRF